MEVSEIAKRTTNKTIASSVSIVIGVLALAGTFYTLVSRVSVAENRIDNLEDQLKIAQSTADKYQDLAMSIDRRLATIEGVLGRE
jgi:glycine cleavage system regulatory protein